MLMSSVKLDNDGGDGPIAPAHANEQPGFAGRGWKTEGKLLPFISCQPCHQGTRCCARDTARMKEDAAGKC